MKKFFKLLIVEIDTFESRILMEYNLSDKNQVKEKMMKYEDRAGIYCVVVDMEQLISW